jgi:hypothetical protein
VRAVSPFFFSEVSHVVFLRLLRVWASHSAVLAGRLAVLLGRLLAVWPRSVRLGR